MGWWSPCIMGGDTPYDIADILGKKLGGFDYLHMPDSFSDLQQKAVASTIALYGGVTKLIADIVEDYYGGSSACSDTAIVSQVVGLVAMSAGAALTEEDRTFLLDHVIDDLWAHEDDERKERVDALVEAIKAYDGTPVVINQEGLFEVMAKRFFTD